MVASSSATWIKRLADHCTSIRCCKQAHAYLLRSALLNDPQAASKLLSFLALSPSGDVAYADKLFFRLPCPDLFIWNTMIRGHAKGPDPSSALSFFHLMLRAGVAPDHHTYPFVLTACARSRGPEQGMRFHGEVAKAGVESDVFVLNSLIQMYTSCGFFCAAHQLFDGNPSRDVVSWNVMMRGYLLAGFFDEALDLFEEMKDLRIDPDEVTMINLVTGCSRLADLERGRSLHSFANEFGLVEKNIGLENAILDMYCKCGDLEAAKELFGRINGRDLLTWTTMISGLANMGRFEESLRLFGYMQREEVHPDGVILVAVLSACAHMGALDQGTYIHLLIDRNAVIRDLVLETSLVDMYSKCGRLDLALQVFDQMKARNVFSWNAVICGAAMNGHGGQALELFGRMRYEGMMPDEVTFIGVLSACNHAQLVDEGLDLFRLMQEVYLIKPKMEHYGCVVDMLCRAKMVQDAVTFIENMPIRPNAVLLASLAGACKAIGDTDLAENVGKWIIELEPETCDRYVMLSNLYAGVRKWDDALKVRNYMKTRGIDKSPGLSWVEVNGAVQEFVAGDKSHTQTKEIYMMVEEVSNRVKEAGYVSETTEVLFNIEDEEKEHALFLHSEKLAVAYGLISTTPGSPIRITKNLRVCMDCHSFLKAVSKIFNREIITRDRSRFHQFKEGICSCNDYW